MHHLDLSRYVTFTGKVNTAEYLAKIDLICLTSISEAQPLVILEAGAAGIPAVATDAGCCGELIFGKADESPKLGPGGALSPLYNPSSIAENMHLLLSDKAYYDACSKAIRERVHKYYNATLVTNSYKDLYAELMRN
jgi:glycosyltransferase involved in cell wall biosynthesis